MHERPQAVCKALRELGCSGLAQQMPAVIRGDGWSAAPPAAQM
jgi:hypothetical protein